MRYLIVLLLSLLTYSIVEWNSPTNISIYKNIFSGEMGVYKSGLHISPPWVITRKINLEPRRFCIQCDCRNSTCNLIRFNPDGWKEFIDKEGFRFYWFSNRISFNQSNITYRGLDNILYGYSFDSMEYGFIEVDKGI
jgi:hypothetical protein